MKSSFTVTFLPYGEKIQVSEEYTILDAGEEFDYFLESTCGGKGTCGKCKIQLLDGSKALDLDPSELQLLTPEELADKIRLACRRKVNSDIQVRVWDAEIESSAKIKALGEEKEIAVDNGIDKFYVSPELLSSQASAALWDQIQSRLPTNFKVSKGRRQGSASLEMAQSLKPDIYNKGATLTAIDDEPVALEVGDTRGQNYGIAIDIGTTTIAAYLVELNRGETVCAAATTNSQRRWGGDVMSRIQYAMSEPEGLVNLQRRVIQNINGLIGRLSRETNIPIERIYKITLVGNSAMYHLFFGIDPSNLGLAPYMPLMSSSICFRAGDLGIELSPQARAHFLPCIAGFVGADIVGVVIASDILDRDEIVLALDLGTNGETVLGNRHSIVCGSNAAGPAFEGDKIRQGMRAVPGAISDVKIGSDVEVTTVQNVEAKGICGSGLIAAVSELLRVGIIDATGRILDRSELDSKLPQHLKDRIEVNPQRGNSFLLVREGYRGRPVRLIQQDVREVQLATAAIAAGREVLLKELGIQVDDISEVLLAGAFGNYIQPKHAMRIGLIPQLPLEKVKFVGNAAGRGAKYALVSKAYAAKAEDIKAGAKFIEFAGRLDFQELFIESMFFPFLRAEF